VSKPEGIFEISGSYRVKHLQLEQESLLQPSQEGQWRRMVLQGLTSGLDGGVGHAAMGCIEGFSLMGHRVGKEKGWG